MNSGAAWDFLLAFTLVVIAMPVLIKYAPRWGLLDHPDKRKQHGRPVPLVGGLAVFVGLLLVLAVRHIENNGIPALLAAGLLLVAMGVADDRGGLSPRLRFLVQILASALMIFGAGILLLDFGQLLGPWTLPLAWFAVPVTLFCVVGVTNAANMIDGMDGLSGSLLLVALSGLSAAIWSNGGSLSAHPEVTVLAGAVAAYLVFNLRLPWRERALVFFGDAGTLLLGFLLAWLLVRHSQGPHRDIAPVTALWLYAVPLMDTVFLMIRRKRAGKSMVGADRQHIHHALLRCGFGINVTLSLMVAWALSLAMFGLLLEKSQLPEYVSFYAFLALSGLYYLGMSRSWDRKRLFGRLIE